MATNEWTGAQVWIFGLSMYCSGMLAGGVLWRVMPFPKWRTFTRWRRR